MSGDVGRAYMSVLRAMAPDERRREAMRCSPGVRRAMLGEWENWAHRGQVAPAGPWRVWLIRAGRGFGKTRAGAEWVAAMARAMPDARIALVGDTVEDVRRVMIEGESGLLNVAQPGDGCVWRSDLGELRWATGACAYVFSASAPEGLRGPQHHAAWCDEIGKWRYGDAAWDNLWMGLRLGGGPRVVATTTPRATNLMRRVMAGKGTVETRGRSHDNIHLPAAYLEGMEEDYGGTRLGRQEIEGELIEDVDGALWTVEMIEACRCAAVPEIVRVVVGVDPPASAGGDLCGIVAVALGRDGVGYVLEDASLGGVAPEGWARAVARCAARHGADRVVAEKNQGGDMVMSVLRAADAALPVRLVHASRGKAARAEPVAMLYAGGKVRHAGAFPALEAELRGVQAGGGYEGPGRSPDRADACVWALWELLVRPAKRAGVRGL